MNGMHYPVHPGEILRELVRMGIEQASQDLLGHTKTGASGFHLKAF